MPVLNLPRVDAQLVRSDGRLHADGVRFFREFLLAVQAAAADIIAHVDDTTDAHDASAISNTPAGTVTSANVQAAINELAGFIAAHLADATDAHDASAISILDAASDFTATDVEGALAELQSDAEADAQALADHIADPTAAHAATAISNTPAGGISATTVQAAINELDTEKFSTASAAALTRTDDTNVTLTLGGTPATALLQATSITVGWSGLLASSRGGTGNGFTKFSGPATAEKTFTLPNATCNILTDNALVTVAQGGTGAATLTGLLQGNGTGAFTAITNSSTVGQVLRVTGASTYAWGALDLADSDAITGDLPFSNLTQGSALSVLGVTGNATADNASIAAGSDHQVLRRSGTAVAFGAVNLAQSAAVTGTLPVGNGGTGLSTISANRIVYATAADTIGSNSGFTFDGTTLTTPGQIAFPATQAPSSNANTLDDYEEGTFTPGLTFGGGSTGLTSTAVGSYTKIGNRVYYTVNIPLSAKGSSTGVMLITGLPFTAGASFQAPGAVYMNNVTSGVGDTSLMGFVIAGSATARIDKMVTGTATQLTDADITNTSVIRISGHYQV